MPPFAAYWRDLDLEDQRALDLLDDAQLAEARTQRARLRRSIADFFELQPADGAAAARDALLGYLAASAARFVLVNLEDLWLETRPQNVPGTSFERPNWRRRARYTIEQLMREPGIAAPLAAIDRQRRRSAPEARRHHETHA
jgi:4-alpha-glucanotransferase